MSADVRVHVSLRGCVYVIVLLLVHIYSHACYKYMYEYVCGCV